MPRKNTVKLYAANSYYHIYNRGVDKRDIFLDKMDYSLFLSYLTKCLLPPPSNEINPSKLYQKIKLVCFCLMPNHFHLLFWQKTDKAITQLMKQVATKYVMYFNRRYKRVGPLFQSIFKAVTVKTDEQLLHLSRYIHLNPHDYKNHPYSSYQSFVGKNYRQWLHPEEIYNILVDNKSNYKLVYQQFVESYKNSDVSIDIEEVRLD